MPRLIFLLICCLFLDTASAQSDTINYNAEVKSVQLPPVFPGGLAAWKRYLDRNLNKELAKEYIKLNNGETVAQQTVIVSFLVDKEGLISEVVALNGNDVHPKLAEEAVKIIKKGPKWMPAQLNGRNVIYRHRQGITWTLEK